MGEVKYFYLVVFTLFALSTLRDLFVQSSTESNLKEIPITRVGSNVNKYLGPTLTFHYCYSCGYQKAYQEYGNILREKYPEIIVEGGNFNPPEWHVSLAKVMMYGKMLIIICVLGSIDLFSVIGLSEPSWWTWCLQNKLYACLMIFFLSNALERHLMSTGAFEIYFNDVPVWSKLETGRIPQPSELFQIIDNHMQFQTEVQIKPGFAK